MSNEGSFDVVVVGAGAAGLLAAHMLTEQKLRVKLLESEALIGGRMYARPGLFDWPLDLGGEFIHGGGTLFMTLCKKHAVSTLRTFASFPPNPYFDDGRPVQEFVYLAAEGKLMNWVEAEKDSDIAHLLAVIRDMGNESEKEVRGETLYHYFVRKGVAQRVLSLADAIYAKTWSTDMSKLSVDGCNRENNKPFAGDDNFILEHSTLELVEKLAAPLDLDLRAEVVSIDVSASSGKAVVSTKDGRQYHTQKVICCAPLPVIKSKEIKFSPPLPSWYEQAVASAGVGVSLKAVLRFSASFWPEGMLFSFCADSICPQLWMDPERPSYSGAKGHSVTCFMTGTQAEAMLQMPTWRVVQLLLAQLDGMFGTKKRRKPATESFEDHSICKWGTIAYTYPTSPDAAVLCGPVHNKAIYFAGEHCGVPASEIATINGAFESGKAAAERVLADLRTRSKL